MNRAPPYLDECAQNPHALDPSRERRHKRHCHGNHAHGTEYAVALGREQHPRTGKDRMDTQTLQRLGIMSCSKVRIANRSVIPDT